MEEAKKKIDETIKEANRLREELAVLKSKSKRKKKIGQYNAAVKKVRMTELHNRAMSISFECVLSSDRCKDAIEAFKKVIELDPGNADAYYESGWSYFCWGKYREAIDMYTKALKRGGKTRDHVVVSGRGDKNENVYSNRGLAYFHSGNYKQAISDYSFAIKLRATFSRDSVFIYINRGDAYSKLSDYQKAINDYDQVK